MRTYDQVPPPPDDDKRWRFVGTTMRSHGYKPHALIETLHTVQEYFGFLDEKAFKYVAHGLRVPLSRVYEVATFYHFFNMKPKGKHTCVVCTGTACFIKGVPQILAALEKEYHIKPGDTTSDGKVSLMAARCVGACGLAPVVTFDGEFVGNASPEKVLAKIREWKDDDAG